MRRQTTSCKEYLHQSFHCQVYSMSAQSMDRGRMAGPRSPLTGGAVRTECRRPCRCCARQPPPPAAARELAGPPEPKSPPASSEPKLPPPPPPRPSSMVRFELKPCSTTSVEYFSTPFWSSICGSAAALDVNLGALLQILLGDLARPSLKITTRCHSVFSLRSPVRLVAPGLRRRDAQIGDRPPVLRAPDFRILAEVADQNDLVDAARHRRSPLDIAGKKSLVRP